MTASLPKYRYRVDAADRIVWADEQWLAFAAENGATDLRKESIIGRPLWGFVRGDETCKLYAEVHARVRHTRKTVVLPFRCDSPTLQRHMQLTIALGEDGELHYESVILRVDLQRYLAVIDPQQPRANSMLTTCSCCKRALLESVGWLEIGDISARLGLFESQKVPQLCYTICPECAQAWSDSSHNGNAA